MNKLRAAVIGVGSLGRHHARVYREIDATRLVAIADPDEAARARITEDTVTKGYSDCLDMLDQEELDLVSVVVPTEKHCEVASEVIRRGIHVLVEKPLARHPDEGRQLVELAKEYGVTLMVGHIERFNPAIVEVKRRLEKQELGQLIKVHAQRMGPYPVRIKDVGVALDLASHDLDIMRYLLDSPVTRIFAETQCDRRDTYEDLVSGLLRFENGAIGVLDINWVTPTKVRQLMILGTLGMYRVDYLTQDVYWYRWGELDDTKWDSLSTLRGHNEGNMVQIYVQKKEPLRVELEAFVNAIQEHGPSPMSGEEALTVLQLVYKLLESAQNNTSVAM
ncbi:MAG: Gfo/Idh/MocA family oxidoreductase [Anaerolineae bacterium]|nr:Gfo/Idh/MocA family oxidoreductase [Anaerolineae bacterium]